MTKCPTCGREFWDGSRAINADQCTTQGDDVCRLVRDRNSLLAAVRLLAKNKCDDASVRGVLAIVEEIDPTRNCPLCEKPLVVGARGLVNPHHSVASSGRLCRASFGTAVGGFLVKK